jgi:hypothetical protein
MKARLFLSLLAVLALGTAPAAAQGLLGSLTGGLIDLTADRQDGNTDADVIIGGDDSETILDLDFGEVAGETGNASVGIPGFADLGNFLPGLDGLTGIGGLTGLVPGLISGGGGDEPVLTTPILLPDGGSVGTTGGSNMSQLAYLAALINANGCGISAGATNVVVVDVSTWLAPREMAGLGSVIASHAGDIAVCQAMLTRAAALLGLSNSQLARVIAVDTRGGNVVLYMA